MIFWFFFLTFSISWTTLGTSETLFKIRQSAWYIQIGRCDSNVSARYFSFNTLSLVKLAQPPILCCRFTHLASFHCIHYVRSLDFARFCYNFAIGSIFHHFSNEFGNENAILQCMAQSVNLYFSWNSVIMICNCILKCTFQQYCFLPWNFSLFYFSKHILQQFAQTHNLAQKEVF